MVLSTFLFFLYAGLHAQTVNFSTYRLQGFVFDNPTSLDFGPDGRLYVAQQDGSIFALTIEKQLHSSPAEYQVIAEERIDLIANSTPNHNDDGSMNMTPQRQITGLLATGTQAHPVLYVTSSDWRIAVGKDTGLDTNSGVISRLTWDGQAWEKVDLVRGFPRSEENHSVNGMDLDEARQTLYVMVGGATNKGAPSNNFAGITEYYLSGALITVDLAQLDNMPVWTDPRGGISYVYDLPTLNDPERPNIDNSHPDFPYPPGHPMYQHTIDPGDPFGGNDGLNQAIIEPGGPVQIYAGGFRNAYDVVYTQNNRLYSVDNGPNNGWGGLPLVYDENGQPQGTVGSTLPDGWYITNDFNESNSSTVIDLLHHIAYPGYFGGHPIPIRAFPEKAGLPVYEEQPNNTWQEIARYQFPNLLDSVAGYFNDSIPRSFFPDIPDHGVYNADLLSVENRIDLISSSTNGITEYTASNFGGALQGAILTVSFNGKVNRYHMNSSGGDYTHRTVGMLSGFGRQPLDITTQGDYEIFPGTIWIACYRETELAIFEPTDFVFCPDPASNDFNPTADSDQDGFTDGDELQAGTDPCSGGSRPTDQDNDFISDVTDPDDDNDGIPDVDDAFAIDPHNGTQTVLPISYSFFNNDPGTGFFGLGFTGIMTNGTTDYLQQFDEEKLNAGGATGRLGIEDIPAGTALGTHNDQTNAFQFGFMHGTTPFTVHTHLDPPYFAMNGSASTPPGDAHCGLFIGTGDQDNYFLVSLSGQNGQVGIKTVLEINGQVAASLFLPENTGSIPDLQQAPGIDLYLYCQPASRALQAFLSTDGGISTISIGRFIQLPSSWLAPHDGVAPAVGVVSSSHNDQPFGATWDFLNVYEGAIESAGEAFVEVLADAGLHSSTYAGNQAIKLHNLSPDGLQITGVSIDLSTGILPDIVWDPTGAGGDAVASCITPVDSLIGKTGLLNATDLCDAPYSQPHDGGYDVLTLQFDDFDPGEHFAFSGDIDPNSIKDVSGAGNSGAVSGIELAGALVTVWFNDGTSISGNLFDQGSQGGSQAYLTYPTHAAPQITMPELQVTATYRGIAGGRINSADQVIQVEGTPGHHVTLLQLDAQLYINSGAPPYGITTDDPFFPFYTNKAEAYPPLYTAQIGSNGLAEIPVTLLETVPQDDGNGTGNNHFLAISSATPYQVDQPHSKTSNILVAQLDPTYIPTVLQWANDHLHDQVAAGNYVTVNDALQLITNQDTPFPGTASLSVVYGPGHTGWIQIPSELGYQQMGDVMLDATSLPPGYHTAQIIASHDGPYGQDTLTFSLLVLDNNGFCINAGGTNYTSSTGMTFSQDQYYTGGSVHADPGTDIEQTTNDDLYHTVRQGDFVYQLPLPDGTYELQLHLAETYWGSLQGAGATGGVGHRVFQLLAEAIDVFPGGSIDIYEQAAGADVALVRTYPVTITGGNGLSLEFLSLVDQAWLAGFCVTPAPFERCYCTEQDLDIQQIESGCYQAEQQITTNAAMNSNQQVALQAGQTITFTPGFSTHGGELHARIVPCAADNVPVEASAFQVPAQMPDAATSENAFSLRIIPNPAYHQASISYSLPERSPVSIQLIDLNGQVIDVIWSGQILDAGTYSSDVQLDNLSAGIYLVEFNYQGGRQLHKLVHLRY
mgnify:CR=1 FL=1